MIWDALFVKRSPISEATRGVLTTLSTLGLEAHVKTRDLAAIRRFYEEYRKDGLSGAERFSELTYKAAGVQYAIMTNIPFDPVRHILCLNSFRCLVHRAEICISSLMQLL